MRVKLAAGARDTRLWVLALVLLAVLVAVSRSSSKLSESLSEYTNTFTRGAAVDALQDTAQIIVPRRAQGEAISGYIPLGEIQEATRRRFRARNHHADLAMVGDEKFALVLGSFGTIGTALVKRLIESETPVLVVEGREHLDLRDPGAMGELDPIAHRIGTVYLLAFDVRSERVLEDQDALMTEVLGWLAKRPEIRVVYPTLGASPSYAAASGPLELVKRAGEEMVARLPNPHRIVRLTEERKYTCFTPRSLGGGSALAKCGALRRQGSVANSEEAVRLPYWIAESGRYLSPDQAAEVLIRANGPSFTVSVLAVSPKGSSAPTALATAFPTNCIPSYALPPREAWTALTPNHPRLKRFQGASPVGATVEVSGSPFSVQSLVDQALAERPPTTCEGKPRTTMVLARGVSTDTWRALATLRASALAGSSVRDEGCLEILAVLDAVASNTHRPVACDAGRVRCVETLFASMNDPVLEALAMGLTVGNGAFLLLVTPEGNLLPSESLMARLTDPTTSLRGDTVYVGVWEDQDHDAACAFPSRRRRRVYSTCSSKRGSEGEDVSASCMALPNSVLPGPVRHKRFAQLESLKERLGESSSRYPPIASAPLSRREHCDLALGALLAHRSAFESLSLVQLREGDAARWTWTDVLVAAATALASRSGGSCSSEGRVVVSEAMRFTSLRSDAVAAVSPSLTEPTKRHALLCHPQRRERELELSLSAAVIKHLHGTPLPGFVEQQRTQQRSAVEAGPASCATNRTVSPVLVVWPALMPELRSMIGALSTRAPRPATIVVPFELSYEQMFELGTMENIVLLTKERLVRQGNHFSPYVTQLHGLQQAAAALPDQNLVLIDLSSPLAKAHPVRTGVDLERIALDTTVTSYGPTNQVGHLPLLHVPGRSASSEAAAKHEELTDFIRRTQSCVERSLDPLIEAAKPTASACLEQARSFVQRWALELPVERGTTAFRLPADNRGFCFVEHARRAPPSNPIPADKQKNSICIVTPTLGKRGQAWKQHPMFNLLLPTLVPTISPSSPYYFRHYVAYEFGDPTLDNPQGAMDFENNWKATTAGKNMDLFLMRMPFISGDTSYLSNQAFQAAFQDGCEYLWYICDDIGVRTPNWDTAFVEAMKKGNPTNTGMVGVPSIFNTQPFVHRSHMEAFGIFYHKATHNWYGDTIIYDLYRDTNHLRGPNFSFINKNTGGERYVICSMDHVPLVQEWREKLNAYEARFPTMAKTLATAASAASAAIGI